MYIVKAYKDKHGKRLAYLIKDKHKVWAVSHTEAIELAKRGEITNARIDINNNELILKIKNKDTITVEGNLNFGSYLSKYKIESNLIANSIMELVKKDHLEVHSKCTSLEDETVFVINQISQTQTLGSNICELIEFMSEKEEIENNLKKLLQIALRNLSAGGTVYKIKHEQLNLIVFCTNKNNGVKILEKLIKRKVIDNEVALKKENRNIGETYDGLKKEIIIEIYK